MSDTAPIIRCPYCQLGGEFRSMKARIAGWWWRCENCGHNVMPEDLEFKCACLKCQDAQSRAFVPGAFDSH